MKNPDAFRPKYSPAIVKRVCSLISDGLNNRQACEASGISESAFLQWRKQHPDFADKVAAAREKMRASVLAKIKAAGKDDWRALECFLRLSFAEYRFTNANQVNVAIQQNTMEISDKQRAELIARREAALLANKEGASEPKQLDASNAREIALEAESKIAKGVSVEVHDPEPERLREKPPQTVIEVERVIDEADWRKEMRRCSAADEVDEILGD